MLTGDDIVFLIEALRAKTVVHATKDFPYRIVSAKSFGYAEGRAGQIQAKLSIMLEAARRREGGEV